MLVAQIQIVLHRVLEDGPVALIQMLDRIQLSKAQQAAQVVGIFVVALVRTAADQ